MIYNSIHASNAMKISVNSKITDKGFMTLVNSKRYETVYPRYVWNSVPKQQRKDIAECCSYFVTRHLALLNNTITYDFPPPSQRLFFDYGLYYSLTEAPFEFPEKEFSTSTIIKNIYNSEFHVQFNDIPNKYLSGKNIQLEKKSIVMPISFGKDSLLTYSILRELKFDIHPFFFQEPHCPFQNAKKMILRRLFNNEFSTEIQLFPNALGTLRQKNDPMWGWDMLLTQYTALLAPFVFYWKASCFFWSNEQSTNENENNHEGYIVNPTHEQSVSWIIHLNNLFRMWSLNTHIGSLLEPLHELIILYILHTRYPAIGKYQLSCDGEKTKNRWCGHCFECARVFLFLTALGIDPKRVGLMDDMFTEKKLSLFYLFSKSSGTNSLDIVFQSYSERLLAFYLVYKRGIRGYAVYMFKKKLLPYVLKHKRELYNKYFSLYPSRTIPNDIKPNILRIYQDELKHLKHNLL